MTRSIPSPRSAVARAWPALLALAAIWPAGQATAYSVAQNVAFTVVNQNPWTSGDAFRRDWTFNDLRADVNPSIPAVPLSPTAALGSFLGLPEIGFMRVEAGIAGSAGLELGYYVDGGRMNLQYPGTGLIDVQTRAGTNIVSTVTASRTTTGFTSGLTRDFVVAQTDLRALGGVGYDPGRSIPGFESGRFRDPGFQTYFPTAAAWATFDYSVAASINVQAGVLRFRNPLDPDEIVCVGCVQRRFSTDPLADRVTLLDVNPRRLEVIGLGAVELDRDIRLGAGSVRVSYPDVSVRGTMQAPGQLGGDDAKPIITLNGDLEKLVPFIGPFLRVGVGPAEVKLLGVSGGPKLSLYQDFDVDVKPRVELTFSSPVRFKRADGSTSITQVVTVDAGEAFNWTPVVGSTSGKLTVQPRYLLGGTVRNQTGFAIGYQVDVDALEADIGIARLGPIDIARLDSDDAIRLPAFYDQSFALTERAVQTRSFELLALSPVLRDGIEIGEAAPKLLAYAIVGREGGLTRVNVAFELGGLRGTYARSIVGEVKVVESPFFDVVQLALDMPEDLIIDVGGGTVVNLGRSVCLNCVDGADQMTGSSPSFSDGLGELYVNTLLEGEFRTDGAIDLDSPFLNRATTDPLQVAQPRWQIGDPLPSGDFGFGDISPAPVPEPPAVLLMLLGAGLLLGRQRIARR